MILSSVILVLALGSLHILRTFLFLSRWRQVKSVLVNNVADMVIDSSSPGWLARENANGNYDGFLNDNHLLMGIFLAGAVVVNLVKFICIFRLLKRFISKLL